MVVTPPTNTGKKVKTVCAKRIKGEIYSSLIGSGGGVGGGEYVCVCVFL